VKKKRLIVNADDLGMSRGITDGILLAHQRGIVTSASLMVNQAASDYALEQLLHAPKLDVGIHLNLCAGFPVLPPSEVPTLVTKQGKFYSPREIIRKLWRWQVSPGEIEAEFRAQIRWMKARGLTPTHADSHHRVHQFPPAARPFRRALVTEGIRRIRAPRPRYWPRDGHSSDQHSGPLIRRLLAAAYMGLLQFGASRKFLVADCCVVLHPRYRGKLDLLPEAWAVLLENLPPGTYELVCHPGLSEPGFSEDDDFCERRELELQILTGPQLRSVLERNNITLIVYSDLDDNNAAAH
jgi:hypothetical protein